MASIKDFLRVTTLWIVLFPHAITFIGAASNQFALIANHDKMPVLVNDAKLRMASGNVVEVNGTVYLDPRHCEMTSKTHLNFLGDVFDFSSETDSIGDLIIGAGDWLATFCPYVWMAVVVMKLLQSNK